MLIEMAGSRSCRGSAFHEDGPDEQNARGPSMEVDVYEGRTVCVDQQNAVMCGRRRRQVV